VAPADRFFLQRPIPISNGPTVLAANGNVMHTTLHGTLPLSPLLSDTAQSAYVTDALKTGTLISLAQLCDDGCLAVFSNKDVKIHKKDSVIITGTAHDSPMVCGPFLFTFLRHPLPCNTLPTASSALINPNKNLPCTIMLLLAALLFLRYYALLAVVISLLFPV
jgi:hypothetical protein